MTNHPSVLVIVFVLIYAAGCSSKNWQDLNENPCYGMKIRIGSMGDSDAAEQLALLLKPRLVNMGFIIVEGQEKEEAILTGKTTIKEIYGGEVAHVDAQLNDTSGKLLWSGHSKPHIKKMNTYLNLIAPDLDKRASDVASKIVNACSPSWRAGK